MNRAGWDIRARPMEYFAGAYTFGGHSFAVQGRYAPVAAVRFGGDTPVLFEQHTLLWREPSVRLRPGPSRIRRVLHGEDIALVQASGFGQAAFSPRVPSRVFMLYLPSRESIELRQHHCVCAAGLSYEAVRSTAGFWLDRFTAGAAAGLLILHGSGDVYEVALEPDESLDVRARSLLYKEQSVVITSLPPGSTHSRAEHERHEAAFTRCTGPGLIAVQTAGRSPEESADG